MPKPEILDWKILPIIERNAMLIQAQDEETWDLSAVRPIKDIVADHFGLDVLDPRQLNQLLRSLETVSQTISE